MAQIQLYVLMPMVLRLQGVTWARLTNQCRFRHCTGKAGVDLSIVSRYGTITAKEFKICDGAGNNCGQSPGGLTVQSQENATLHFITKDGLFSPTSLSSAEISLKRVNIFLSQMENLSAPTTTAINQLF
jgi:hypothetical protein